MSVSRPLGLRRRDAHLVACVATVALCNVATTVVYWFVLRMDLRTVAESAASDLAPVAVLASNAVTRADALAAVLVRHSGGAASGVHDVDESTQPPRVLGVGRTKTHTGARMLYYDVRDSDGEVSRHYVRPGRNHLSMQNSSAVPNVEPESSERSDAAENVTDRNAGNEF